MTGQIHAQVIVLPHLAVGIAQLRTPVDHPVRSKAFDECARSCAIWPLDRRDDGSVALAQQRMQLFHRQHHRMAPRRGRSLARPVPGHDLECRSFHGLRPYPGKATHRTS